jgi:hypothetical protein
MDYISFAREEATRQGIDPDLVAAVLRQESGGKADAVSPKGARGLMQVMPETGVEVAQKIGLTDYDHENPEHNIKVGVSYLKEQLDTFKDTKLALAAYNAGPEAVKKYGGVPPYKETQDYVAKITGKLPLASDVTLSDNNPIKYSPAEAPLQLMGYSAEQKAALYTAMISGNPFDLYKKVQAGFQSGDYSTLDSAYEKIRSNDKEAMGQMMQRVINDPTIHPEDKVAFLQEASQLLEREGYQSYVAKAEAVKNAALEAVALNAPVYDEEDKLTSAAKLESLFAKDHSSDTIAAMAVDSVERVGESTSILGDVVSGVRLLLEPISSLPFYRGVIQQVAPELDEGFASFATAADYLAKIKKWKNSVSGEERIYRAAKIIEAMEEKSSYIGDANRWMFTQGVSEVFSEELGNDGKGLLGVKDETLHNVFHWLDVATLGAGAALKWRNIYKYKSLLKEFNEASRKTASELATAAVDSKAIQEATKITPEVVAASQVPSIARGDKLGEIYASLMPEHKKILQLSGEAKWNLLSKEEQTKVIEELKARAEDYAKHGNLHLMPGTSAINHGDASITVQAVYSKNVEHGWRNPGAALTVGKSKFPEYNVSAVKNEDTGEYFLKVDIPYNYDASLTKNMSNFMLNGDAVLTNGEVAIPFKPLAMIRPPEAIFTKEAMQKMIRGTDYRYTITTRVADSMKPLISLPSSKQHQVMKAVGEMQDKVGIEKQAIYDALPKDVQRGVDIFRSVSDMQFIADNAIRHNQLSADGFMHVINYSTKEEFFARPLKDNNSVVGQIVFNPSTGRSVVATQDMQIARLEKPIVRSIPKADGEAEEVKFEYIVIDGKKTKLTTLPQQVLPYKEGYITRYYDSNVFVTNKEGRAVASFGNIDDAKQWMKENPGDYDMRLSRELQANGTLNYALDDITASYGGPVFGRRGDMLKGKAPEQVKDPIAALYNTVQAFASRQTIRNLTTDLRQRFMNTYAEFLPKDKIGQPMFPDEFGQMSFKNIDPDSKKMKEQAHQWFKQIKMLEGAERSFIDASFTKMMTEVATSSAFTNNKFIQEAAFSLANSSPTTAARTFAFYFWMAGNPGRQLLMQSIQPLFLAGIKPTAVAQGYPAAMALLSGDKRAIKAVYGKMADDVAYAFEESGLRGSVSGHQWVEAVEKLSVNKGVFNKGWDFFVGKPAELLRYIGFDAGEKLNLGVTWHVALKRHLDKFPNANLRDRAVIDAIAADARQLSLNMGSRAGNTPYNHGDFSVLFQFQSAQHKATLTMLPEKWGGSRAFTPQEKLQLALGNFLIHGLDGVGMLKQYESWRDRSGINIDPEVDRWLKGGMLEHAVNEIASAVTEEYQDVDFSSDFAILSDGKLVNTSAAIISLLLSPTATEQFLLNLGQAGISLNDVPAMGALHQAIAAGEALFGNKPLDTPERIARAISEFNPIFGQMSNTLRARAAWNLETMVSRNGDIQGDATKFEAFMLAIAGLKTQQETDVAAYKEERSGKYVQKPVKVTIEDDVKEDSKKIYQEIKKQLMLTGFSGWDSTAGAYKSVDTILNKMRSYFEHNGEKDYYWKMVEEDVMKLIAKDLTGFIANPKEYRNNEMVEAIVKGTMRGEVSDARIHKLQYAIGQAATPEQKALLEDALQFNQNYVKGE